MTLPKIDASLAINAGTAATTGKILVLHATANTGATAKNGATYEHRAWRTSGAFVHYIVDDVSIYQLGQPGRKAWGAGNVNGLAPVQIELCQFSDKAQSLKAYRNWVSLAKSLAIKYGIPITLDSSNRTAGIKTHNWCSRNYGGSDHVDPVDWLKSIGISQGQLAKDLGAATASTVTAVGEASSASGKLTIDGSLGPATIAAWQRHEGTTADGVLSKPSAMVKVVQHKLGLTQDGYMGPLTIKAMQRKLELAADGVISTPKSNLVMAIQRNLNAGTLVF